MKRSNEMWFLQTAFGAKARGSVVPEMQGVTGWIASFLRGWCSSHETQQKQLKLVETLALGGKKQLLLVSCGGERFLVGGGVEGIETIIRLASDQSQNAIAQDMDGLCL